MPSLVSFLARNLRATVFVAALLLCIGGFAAFHLRREIEPQVHNDYAAVTAALPGSTAGELLAAVTRPVEDLLRRTPGVVDFDSRTVDGFCVFTARLAGGNPLEVRERLRNQLSELHDTLAAGIVGLTGPRLDDSISTTYDLVAGIPAPGGDLKKLREALPALIRELSSIASVESVEITGLPADQIVVEYTDAELADSGFSPLLLSGLIRSQSVVAPGSYLDDKKAVAPLHLAGRVSSLEELRAVGILDPVTGRATTLDRLLEIRTETRTPPAAAVSVAGQAGVQIAVARRAGADLREFSARVRARLETSAAAGLPKPVVLIDASDFVQREYRNFARGLGVSALVIFVLLVGAMGFRAGSLAALMVPAVLLATLAVLQFAGFRLNIVVLAALTIASGIIADNHIVVVQFISRRLRRGEPRAAVLEEAFRVLSGPLLAATLTAMAGFLPVLLTDQAASEYVSDLAPVIAIALGISYVFAFALTPFLCGVSDAASPAVRQLERLYGRTLGGALRDPFFVVVWTVIIGAAGLGLLWTRPTTFFPSNQSTTLAVEVHRPAGASQNLVESDIAAVGAQIAQALHQTNLDRSAAWMTLSGRDLPRTSVIALASPPAPNFAVALVSLPSPDALEKFGARLRQNFAPPDREAFLRLREITAGPQALWPIHIRLSGPADALAKAAAETQKTLVANPALANLHQASGAEIAKWTLAPKRAAAADKAVTPADIATAMNATLNGLPCFELTEGDLSTPVIIRAKPTTADPIENLKDAYVYPAKGRPCVLSDVADVTTFPEAASFERQRGVPTITFLADCAPDANPYAVETAAVAALRQRLAPSGVSVASAGLADTAGEANRALLAQIPLALAAVLLILLAQTHSLRLSLLVLAAIPFGLAGAGFGLALAGLPSGFMPLIGLTAMAGIVVNIAIVMAASLAGRRASATDESADARIAAAATDRVEPIVLSALCTLGGMIPLYFFGGPLWHSMAVTLTSGLIVATGFLIMVIPSAFKWLRLRSTSRDDR